MTSHHRFVQGTLCALAGALWLLACGTEERQVGGVGPNSTTGSGGSTAGCQDGAVRSCKLELPSHNGVVSCVEGEQRCEDGSWGACQSEEMTAESKSGFHPTALSQETDCTGNPCDPTCQVFDEQPQGGVTSEETVVGSYQGGSISSIPPGFQNKGFLEPCLDTSDCQFDHYCYSPDTESTCLHSKCTSGAALSSACEPCVADVCAAQPSCCDANSGSWDASCIDGVASECGAFCETDPGCAHDKCYEGPALTQGCDGCVDQICQVDPYCCDVEWDSICVDEVDSVCGESCPDPDGQCVPWSPGETDPSCAGYDFTVGVPCTGSLPVCNRGNSDAPAGVVVYAYSANSSHFPVCQPDKKDHFGVCIVPVPIEAGHCVTITNADCMKVSGQGDVLSGNNTMMVNPPSDSPTDNPNELPECYCENNWSDYHSGGCETNDIYEYEPTTYTETYEASCPDGKTVQWGVLTWDTTTPGDASVDFEVRTADTTSMLAPPSSFAGTAQSATSPDTSVCSLSGPSPDCPVDLYQVLDGSPDAHQPVLELIMTINPTSDKTDTATVNDWQITYSCIDAS